MTGLIGWWPLNEDYGIKAIDISGKGNHGSLNGGLTQGVVGKAGLTAYSFDGSDDYLDIPNIHTYFNSSPPATFSAYVKTSSSDWQVIMGSVGSSSTRSGAMQITSGNLSYYDAAGTHKSSLEVADGQWHHIAVVDDGKDVHYYVDGKSETASGESDGWDGGDYWVIGRREAGPGKYFDGKMTDIRAYNRALSPQEIQKLYENGFGDYTKQSLSDGSDSGAVSRWNPSTDKFNTILEDSFTDGDHNGWTEESGTWSINSYNGDNWVENTSSGNDEVLYRDYNSVAPDKEMVWEFTHNHGGQFYGAQGYIAHLDSNNHVYINLTNTNNSYERVFYIIENGTVQVEKSLGNYDGSTHSYRIEYDGSGNWNISVDGSEKSTATYTPGFDFSQFRFQADDAGHRFDDVLVKRTSDVLADNWSSNTGTFKGDASVTDRDAIRGSSLSFDGSGDSIPVNSGNDFSIDFASTGLTVSGWVKTSTKGSRKTLWSGNGSSAWWNTRINENERPEMWYGNDGSNSIITASKALKTGEWYHLAYTAEPSNYTMKIFINGVEVASGGNGRTPSDKQFSTNSIGERQDDEWMDGLLDDVRIYNRALEPHEVFELYQWGTRGKDMRKHTINARGDQ